MSHWVIAKEALDDPDIACFVRQCRQKALANGFALQEPDYPPNDAAVEIFFNQMNSEKSLAFSAAMRVRGIDFSSPSGPTGMVSAEFHAAIREFEKFLTDAVGLRPDAGQLLMC